jgi:hypothetical protein
VLPGREVFHGEAPDQTTSCARSKRIEVAGLNGLGQLPTRREATTGASASAAPVVGGTVNFHFGMKPGCMSLLLPWSLFQARASPTVTTWRYSPPVSRSPPESSTQAVCLASVTNGWSESATVDIPMTRRTRIQGA